MPTCMGEWRGGRLRINPNIDQMVDLDELPGGRDLYILLAAVFLESYEDPNGCYGMGYDGIV